LYQFDADLLLGPIVNGGTFVLNSPYVTPELMEEKLPGSMKRIIAQRGLKFFNIDANDVARKTGMGKLINNIMQACFYKLSGVLPEEQALQVLKNDIAALYTSKGPKVLKMNYDAVDAAVAAVQEIKYPESWATALEDAAGPASGKAMDSAEVPSFVGNI
jgi:pyruvate-ferredoxin/flavodoxin oxidoreductase